jgi:hypothetical protein
MVMSLSRWVRKELQPGDLSMLAELANGSTWGQPDPERYFGL